MTTSPVILAFDTSAAHCTAALLAGNQIIASAHEEMAKGQAERLMLLLQETLDAGGLAYSDLSAIAVGVGPGNFTGIRISVSAARGLALGLGVPAVGTSVLEAQVLGTDGPVLSSVDARRDSVYLQAFEGDATAEPEQHLLDALPTTYRKTDLTVIGGRSDIVAQALGAKVASAAYPLAEAMARLAASRLSTPQPRPKPLYIRPADATPPRQPAPVIVP